MIDKHTGRGAAWLARLTGGQEVGGSNPLAPNVASGCNLLSPLDLFSLSSDLLVLPLVARCCCEIVFAVTNR